MQTPFHQEFTFGLVNHLNGLGCCRVTVWCIDDLDTADVEMMLACHGDYLCSRPNENRNNDAGFRCFDSPAQRCLIARMYDDGRDRWHLLCLRDEAVIFRERRMGACTDRHNLTALPGDHFAAISEWQ